MERTFAYGITIVSRNKNQYVFDELRNQTAMDDADSHSVYNYFKEVCLTSPGEPLVSEQSAVRQNNAAKAFHAALSRRILHNHPRFNLFARQLVQVIDESKTRHE